jgi:cobalamin synthase
VNAMIEMMVVFIKKLLSPILHKESLHNIDVKEFINRLYPIGLSLILAFLVHQISNGSWPDNWLIFAARILITSLLILYVLFDWDDCHYAAKNKEQNTAYDKILWLLAIFWLSLVTVLFLSFSTIERLTNVLAFWLAYVVVTSLSRDWLIEKQNSTNKNVVYVKLTQTQEYGAYSAYRKTIVIIWSVMFIALLIFKYPPSFKLIRERIDWNPSAKAIEFLSGLECFIIYICFVSSVLLAVWLKEKRKEILFLGYGNSQQTGSNKV